MISITITATTGLATKVEHTNKEERSRRSGVEDLICRISDVQIF